MKPDKKHYKPIRFFFCLSAASSLCLLAAPMQTASAKAADHLQTTAAASLSDARTTASKSSSTDIQAHLFKKATDLQSKKAFHIAREDSGKIELSLEDAVSLAEKEASRYYDDLHLTMVYSYDNDQVRDKYSGFDGKREWWYVNFANEKSNYVSVLIADGEILHAVYYDNNGYNGLFDLSDVTLSAQQAAKKAHALGLNGGDPANENDWVSGYNFNLSYSSLATSPDDKRLFFEVIGISPNGNFAHVDFDAMTGELLLAEEKIEYPNGDVEWRTFVNE